jgi:hypothetical protein
VNLQLTNTVQALYNYLYDLYAPEVGLDTPSRISRQAAAAAGTPPVRRASAARF